MRLAIKRLVLLGRSKSSRDIWAQNTTTTHCRREKLRKIIMLAHSSSPHSFLLGRVRKSKNINESQGWEGRLIVKNDKYFLDYKVQRYNGFYPLQSLYQPCLYLLSFMSLLLAIGFASFQLLFSTTTIIYC